MAKEEKIPPKRVNKPVKKIPEKAEKLSNETINLLNQKIDVLKDIINEYESTGAVVSKPAEIEIKPPFKNVNFNLMTSLHKDFIKACKKTGKSQRKVIHGLLKGFVDKVESEK